TTPSARVAFLNINSGNPTASFSAGSAGAAFITSTGNIQTTAGQSLTLGGGKSGNVVLSGTTLLSSLGLGVVHSSAIGLLTSSGIVAADLTAGDFSSAINSGTYSINISGNASTSSASFYAVNAGLASFANAAATSSTTFYATNAGHASSADAATSATTASAAFTATHVTSVDLANNVGSSVLGLSNGGTNNSISADNGAIVYSDSSKLTLLASTGTAGLCLTSGSHAAPTWASCSGTQSADSWDILSNGTIAPRYAATEDLLLGGTSTSTAKFAVLNIAGGIPAASVSAQNAANQALVLGSDGSIQTVRNQTLTIGGGTTGNIVLKPNNRTNGTIQFSGYGTGIIHSVNGLLTSSGIVAADLTAGDFSSAINSGTYSINISGNASTSSAS